MKPIITAILSHVIKNVNQLSLKKGSAVYLANDNIGYRAFRSAIIPQFLCDVDGVNDCIMQVVSEIDHPKYTIEFSMKDWWFTIKEKPQVKKISYEASAAALDIADTLFQPGFFDTAMIASVAEIIDKHFNKDTK